MNETDANCHTHTHTDGKSSPIAQMTKIGTTDAVITAHKSVVGVTTTDTISKIRAEHSNALASKGAFTYWHEHIETSHTSL
jgi:hypothetical protein